MNERKYMIQDNRLVKKIGEVPIPDDEPLFILRAQDRKALPALTAYCSILDTLEHRAEVTKSINDFREFQEKNPERMKEPD
jgi:hypothetical protein